MSFRSLSGKSRLKSSVICPKQPGQWRQHTYAKSRRYHARVSQDAEAKSRRYHARVSQDAFRVAEGIAFDIYWLEGSTL